MPLCGVIKCDDEEPDTQNWFARGFEFDIYTPRFLEINFDVSASWLKQEYPTKYLSGVKQIHFPPKPLTEIALYNLEGAAVGTVQSVLSQFVEAIKGEGVDQKLVSHIFAEPTFIRIIPSDFPYVKINGLSARIEIKHSHETARTKTSNFDQLILHELNSDQSHWFAATPAVISLFK
jgi:hypothetical protein